MQRLDKFLRLPGTERRLLVKVTILLSATRLSLRLLPFKTVYEWFEWGGSNTAPPPDSEAQAQLICRAINRAAKHTLGKDSCFPQALTGDMLLKRHGYAPVMRIGVLKEGQNNLRAHAWVELNGDIVIGGPASHVERYTPLPDLENLIV